MKTSAAYAGDANGNSVRSTADLLFPIIDRGLGLPAPSTPLS
jgi:hypothetical protein